VSLLTAEAFDFAHGHTFDAEFSESFFDFFQFERLDNRFDFFHGNFSLGCQRPDVDAGNGLSD